SLLGRGGMGVVYKAVDVRLQRPVALKMLAANVVASPDRRTRFLREAQAAAALTHPAIAQVYDIDEAEGSIFIAMEYVDGKTVSRLIADGELDILGAVEIGHQIAEGLAKAHEAGILHRDIKSDNIMVTKDGHAKLLDFGLAKLLEPATDAPGTTGLPDRTLTRGHGQTMPGAVMGTISYMSPEQARGRDLDPRSDIFSLGIVLYEMATGELPFKGETPLDTMHAIAYEEAQPVSVIRRDLPPLVHRIVSRCLRKKPEDRYPDARALAADLKQLEQDLETGTRRSLPAGERFKAWAERLVASIPYGNKGLVLAVAALAVSIVLLVARVNFGSLIGPAVIALLIYRSARNRKRQMLNKFTQKMARFPEVRAVIVKEDRVMVVADRAPAALYLHVTSLIEGINRKLYFGKHVEAEVRGGLPEEEFQKLLRQTGVVYLRDEAPGDTTPSRD
ncbi:MAG TPA: serine/threonine-protein kinase, partial [Burkholderiales bacterium]|nr:serine/threonine-protein kinase [Burkholderiales bacterium]